MLMLKIIFKKYYFDVFPSEKYFEKQSQPQVQYCLYMLLARIPVAEHNIDHNIDRCRVKDATSVVWYWYCEIFIVKYFKVIFIIF